MKQENKTTEQDIKNNYKWFCESCKKRKVKPITYNLFKKEFIEMQEENKKPERQEELKQIERAFKESLELLK